MHWILQNNLLNPKDLNEIRNILIQRDIPFSDVRLVPFYHIIEPELSDISGDVFVLGSSSLGQITRSRSWHPGYFGDNLDYDLYLKHYGRQMLNWDALIAPIKAIQKRWEKFFIRPVDDSKSFAGEVMDWESFLSMRSNLENIKSGEYSTLSLNDAVVMAPLKEIYAEYRFFVVNGRAATGTRYKIGNKVEHSAHVDSYIYDYVQEMIRVWQPSQAFVMDIADTPDGLRVIELNAINASGFYAADKAKFIEAIEGLASSATSKLKALIDELAEYIKTSESFVYSGWDSPAEVLDELYQLSAQAERGDKIAWQTLVMLFMPTGQLQELSIDSGWGDEYCRLAAKFDEIARGIA